MDVTCERCGTEYDFDDALVSERGTTVKCTNCGSQFRVFRPAPSAGPERWVVRTVDGRELVFAALRELQGAIGTSVVGREDVLSRGGGRPRRLGSIAELEPFFKQAISVAATSTAPGLGLPRAQRQEAAIRQEEPPPKRGGTLPPPPPVMFAGAAADRYEGRTLPIPPGQNPGGFSAPSSREQVNNTAIAGTMLPSSAVAAPISSSRPQELTEADLEPVTIARHTSQLGLSGNERTLPVPIGPVQGGHGPPPVVVVTPGGRGNANEASLRHGSAPGSSPVNDTLSDRDGAERSEGRAQNWTQRSPDHATPAARVPDQSGVVDKRDMMAAAPEPAERPKPVPETRARSATATPTSTPGEVRMSYIPEGEHSVSPRFSMMASRRGSSGRWIVGVVLVGAIAVVGATIGRKYLNTGPAQSPAPAADERVARLLEESEKSLQGGDLEGAKEQLDKASVLAENDPQVVSHLAQLAVVRADLSWLKVRISPREGPEAQVAQAELGAALERMKKAVEAAQALLPSDPAVRRSRVHALRIAGDRAAARALVAAAPATGRTPDDDLMLAALDLAEDKPAWPTVIERLRSAASAEGNLGLARAMLVYALASSGDAAGAKAEHDRITAFTRPHPLTVALLAFLARTQGDKPAASAAPTASASAKPSASASAAPSASAKVVASGPAQGSSQGSSPSPGSTRISDDYVAPNAGTVDVSDMNGHAPAPKPTAPAPSSPPTPPPTPPSVDTSDLPTK